MNSSDMPPFTPERQVIYDTLYQMEFLSDGMPGRRTASGVVPHPIYPTYIIPNYLKQWKVTGDDVYLTAARKVADAALTRMDEFKGGLVFWYTEEMGLTGLPGTFYSGLTQGRYLEVLALLAEAAGEKRYLEAAEKILNSLALSVSEGGVSRESHGGLVIEEWPHSMMSIYTLNGWATAMIMVSDFAKRTGSEQARKLFRRNVVALEAVIQNFDHEELANTRYGLAGHVYLRVVFPHGEGTVYSSEIEIPREGTFPLTENVDKTRWTNYYIGGTSGRLVRMNAVLNYASAPDPNLFRAVLSSANAKIALIQIMGGEYVPTQTRQKNTEWVTVSEVPVSPEPTEIDASIPWAKADLVSYPTAFTKRIGGKNYNAYHFIHIRQVRRIAASSGSAKLSAYADKWATYPRRWADMPVYAGAGIELEPYYKAAASAP